MLMSDRIRISDRSSAAAMRSSAAAADCANSMAKRPAAQVAPELLAEQLFDVRFIIDDKN